MANTLDFSYIDLDSSSLELTLAAPLGAISASLEGPEGVETVTVVLGEAIWDKAALDNVGFTWDAELTVTYTLPAGATEVYDFTIVGKPACKVSLITVGTLSTSPIDVRLENETEPIDFYTVFYDFKDNFSGASSYGFKLDFGTHYASKTGTLSVEGTGIYATVSLDSFGVEIFDIYKDRIFLESIMRANNTFRLDIEDAHWLFSIQDTGAVNLKLRFFTADGEEGTGSAISLTPDSLTVISNLSINSASEGNGNGYLYFDDINADRLGLQVGAPRVIHKSQRYHMISGYYGPSSNMETITLIPWQSLGNFSRRPSTPFDFPHLRNESFTFIFSGQEYPITLEINEPTMELWAYQSGTWNFISDLEYGTINSVARPTGVTQWAVCPIKGSMNFIFAGEMIQMETNSSSGVYSTKPVTIWTDYSISDTGFTRYSELEARSGQSFGHIGFGAVWDQTADVNISSTGTLDFILDSTNESGFGPKTYSITFT